MVARASKTSAFNPAQYELINMMSCLHKDEDLSDLKSVLVQFLNARMQHEIDGLYDNGTPSDEKMRISSSISPFLRRNYRRHRKNRFGG